MKVRELPISERPREKLISKGVEYLSDKELLAIVLGKGTQQMDVLSLAEKVVTEIDKMGMDIDTEELLKIPGIGMAKTTLLSAAFEFVRRRIKPEGIKIRFPSDVIPVIKHLTDRKQEYFITVSLNGANEVINVRVVTIGLVNKTQVHPREVFADVITDRASALVVAHNHPSGDLTPSMEDIQITEVLADAARLLGIKLLDHLIISHKGYYSFQENHEPSLH